MKKTKKILIIYTGGTIGMIHSHQTRTLVPFDFSAIKEQIPELKHLNCQIHFHAFRVPIDSSNVHPDFWVELAELIDKKYKLYDGFVILHGTDTMAYTASALSFMLENLAKPVILTGSQLPLGAIRTDAKRNLITTIQLAASDVVIPEVCIYFSSRLFRGNRCEKYTSSKFDAFESFNYPALAETGVHIVMNKEMILEKPKKSLRIHTSFDTNIALIKIYPGINVEVIESTLRTQRLKALVLETFGSGNAPTDKAFIDALSSAIKRKILIVNVSQCSGGAVEQGKYETSLHLKEIGVLSGGDMTTESALVKLMFLIGEGMSQAEIKKLFTRDLRGELTTER
ncbi:MAG: asparaginase [Bacteroidia bacterium]|nr:asparaginase [Bacteroidia bacterium]